MAWPDDELKRRAPAGYFRIGGAIARSLCSRGPAVAVPYLNSAASGCQNQALVLQSRAGAAAGSCLPAEIPRG